MLFRILSVFFLTFTLHAATIAESESNNNCSLADAITIFDTGTGNVSKFNDPDDYWIFTTPSSAGTLRIYTTGYNINTDSDGYLYSNTDCTNYLIRDYRTTADVDLSYSVTKNTTYYFRMNAFNGNNNPYVLNFQFTSNNHAPVITQPNNGNAYALSHPENTPLSLDIDATDSDNDTLTYSLSGTDASSFTINPSTGVISFVSTPDFESPTDSDHNNIYLLRVTVTDNGYPAMSDTQDITITVTDINEIPIVDYRFDECLSGSPVVDSSPSALNAAPINSPTVLMSEKICRSKTFNGTNQYLTIPAAVANRLKTTATLSFWIKTTQTGNNTMWLAPGVTGVEQAGGANDVFWGWLDANGRIGIMKGDTAGAQSTTAVNDGNWRHIVLTRNSATGLVQIFVNGSLNSQATSATGDVTTNFTSIAQIEDTGGTPTYFNGSLDEIKVYDRVLSSTEINTLYSNENSSKNYDGTARICTACAPSPLVEYRFDECSWNGTANEVTDSINSYNATAVNNASTSLSDKILCGAADLTTATKYIELPSTRYIPLASPWSMTSWIKFPLDPTGHQSISGYNYFILGSVQGGGDLAYFGRNTTNGSMVWGVYSLSGGSAQQAIATPSSGWHFVTFTNDGSNTKFYLDNVYIGSVNKATTGNVRYIGTSYDSPTGQNIGTLMDETKFFSLLLSDEQRSYIYSNESAGYAFDGSTRSCPDCTVITEPAVSFDAWDSFRSISDRKISTKIVNKPFDLTIASLNETNSGLQNFTGTACARLIDSAGNALTDWNKLTFTAEQSKTATFILNRAIGGSDNARVSLMWQKNASVSTACDALSDTNTTVASDRFAVRPASFSVSAPNTMAGTDFSIVFNAPNFSGTPSMSYNESTPGTFSVSVAEHKSGCLLGTFTPVPTSFAFLNGTKTLTTRYSEVGVLDINITDLTKPCTSRFAQIDCNDANVSGSYNSDTDLPIGLAQTQISVIPHHFDISAIQSNFAGDTFTYLSDDLDMSANLRLTATAKNGEGTTTLNYTGVCYAKNTTLTLPHTSVPDPLSQILYIENLTGISGTVSKTNDIVLSLPNSIFTAGVAPLDLDFNFDRSPTKPLNPFDFSFTSAQIIDTDGVSGTGTPLGSSLFVYGRVHAYDVTTNTSSAPNPVEFEAYSTVPTGFVSGMPQNILKWYRNLNHDTSAQGNVIRGGFSAGTTDAAVDASAIPQNGVQIVTVTSAEDRTVHLDISPWLWYSPKYSYDYNGACTRHPCFLYDYTNATAGIEGVNSGTFQGTDFTMEPAQNITNKGVKVFR